MKLKKPIVTYFNLNSTSEKPNIISLSHTDDKEVDFIELVLHQDLIRFDLTGSTAVARMVWEENNALASDNVACTINDYGNILIPFDSAVIPLHSGILKIEINVTQDGKVFTLQTPLRVRFNPSILENAEITPDSKGTIPELLEEASEQLERVKGFVDAEQVNTIIEEKGYDTAIAAKQDKLAIGTSNELADVSATGEIKRSGFRITTNKSVISTKDSANEFIPNAKATAEYIEEHGGGTSNYNDLENKPQINSRPLSGNKSSDDLGLQKKLTAGTNISINDDGTISASGGTTNYNELENKPQIDGIPIEENQGHEAYNLFGLSRPMSSMLNFGDLVGISSKNGILNATIRQVKSLPEFMNPKDKHFIIFDYQAVDQGIWDIAVWIDAATNEPKMAFRAGTNNIYSVSDWVELTGGGSQIVSGAVNSNGTITFTDIDGNTFTTTGASVVGFSPTATVQQTASGATVTITDKNGTTTANITNGVDGQDYVLTAQDKSDIANIVLSELPTTQEVLYGNTSN